MSRTPLTLAAYERLADRYARRVERKAHNAYYDRPAVLSLLPEVRGLRVLDAGCGPGVYSGLLADAGAEVLAVDVSPSMLEHARRRLGERVQLRQANLEEPLHFAASGSFDLVLSALVLDSIRDLESLFAELFRVLCSPGTLVFSMGHPTDQYRRHPNGSYFEIRVETDVWRGFGGAVNVPFVRRPLGAILGPLFAAGFVVDRLLEPLPTEELRELEPRTYAGLMDFPGFLTVRALKLQPSTGAFE